MPNRYLRTRRQFIALTLGLVAGALLGVVVGAVQTWALGDSGLPSTGGHGGGASLLLGAFVLIGYGGTFLLWFLNTTAVCVAMALLASLLHDVLRSSWRGPKGLSTLLMLAAGAATWVWVAGRQFAHEEIAALVSFLLPSAVAISATLVGFTALVLLRSGQKRGLFLPVDRALSDRPG